MNEKEKLASLERIDIIERALSKIDDNISNYSFAYLLWGWMLALASIMAFLLNRFTTFIYFSIPMHVVILFGVIALLIFYIRKRNISSAHPVSYLNLFIIKLWYVIGMACVPVLLLCRLKGVDPFPFILVLLGIGTLTSGITMSFKPLAWGGYLFFLAALICIIVPEPYVVLVMGLAVIGGYIIPGYLLKRSHNR